MTNRNSSRYEVKVLEELLSNYIEDNSEGARLKLANRIIDGEDLIEALKK